MKHFPLLGLVRELRDLIYIEILAPTGKIGFLPGDEFIEYPHPWAIGPDGQRKYPIDTNFLLANKQIYEECKGILYQENVFQYTRLADKWLPCGQTAKVQRMSFKVSLEPKLYMEPAIHEHGPYPFYHCRALKSITFTVTHAVELMAYLIHQNAYFTRNVNVSVSPLVYFPQWLYKAVSIIFWHIMGPEVPGTDVGHPFVPGQGDVFLESVEKTVVLEDKWWTYDGQHTYHPYELEERCYGFRPWIGCQNEHDEVRWPPLPDILLQAVHNYFGGEFWYDGNLFWKDGKKIRTGSALGEVCCPCH